MMSAEIEVLGQFDPGRSALAQSSDGPLGRDAQDAVERARVSAATRLGRWLPVPVVERLGAYFEDAAVHTVGAPGANGKPSFELAAFLSHLCARPRTVYSAGGDSAAAEVELRTLNGPTDGTQYGAQPEPDSPRVQFSPTRLARALANGLSLGVRQFDRQFTEWAPIVDDIAAVSGADIFTKLFVAGGNESVTDWHRDQSDVVVTMLTGAKQFDVAPATARDEQDPDIEVGAELRSDTALLLPRSRAHCATPVGSISALLSIGIMRHADWAIRSVIPTHLGFETNPRSAAAYRLMLRPHVPAALAPDQVEGEDCWRSRLPGGLLVLDESGDIAEVAALGMRVRLAVPALRALLTIHAAGPSTAAEIAEEGSLTESTCQEILKNLVTAELVAPC
ncbi:MAG: hypothetical protein QOJ29_2790 [Thermoleophilaceae bacterium]|nr:hypothetical protein [Thermoleophilaceae bacterium]